MSKISINTELVQEINKNDILSKYQKKVNLIHKSFIDKTCLGNEMLGWFDYPNEDHSKLIKDMFEIQQKWKKLKINNVVIVGIGGSYTGIKAILDFINIGNSSKINFHFLASLSSSCNVSYINSLINKNWSIIVISKSGTTLESAVNFRILRELLKQQYKDKYFERIVAITDPNKGTLHDICVKHNYKMLPICTNIGGRFSTITPVGLLPALLANIDINEILNGAKLAKKDLESSDLNSNTAYLYAVYRHYLYKRLKYDVEVFVTYETNLEYLCLQHRQLFGESEGKKQDSLYPTYAICTTDLHSMGQLFQEGKKIFFETVLTVNKPSLDINIKKSTFANDDNLDYLANKSLNKINYLISESVMKAHLSSNVNILQLNLPDTTAFTFGYFYFWLCLSASMSASLLGHNPFDQNGVEVYKKLMFKSLGRK